MSDISNHLPDTIPSEFKVIALVGFIFAVIVAICLAISLLVTVMRYVHRKILKQKFLRQFGVAVPAEAEIKRERDSIAETYVLRCPVWRNSKADGTRDLRYKNNAIVRRLSVMRTDGWEVSSYDPIVMNSFVVSFRKSGNALPLCHQEMDKCSRISAERSNRFVGASEIQLYAHFMNDSDGFEEWCAQLLRDGGADVRVTPSTNDGGYDLDIHENGIRTIAECKCYHPTEGSVGRPLLQKLVGANASEHAQRMMFMTTSRYSAPAVEYANEQDIMLIDGKTLMRMDAARRGRMPRQVESDAPRWLLTDEEVMRGYPADYSGRYIRGRTPVASAIDFVLKATVLVGLVHVLLIVHEKYPDISLNPSTIWKELSADSHGSDTSRGQDREQEIEESEPSEYDMHDIGEPAKSDGYVLPDSDSRIVPLEELMDMPASELLVARNEIYARHGCIFEMESLRQHFQDRSWYVPRTPSAEFGDSTLSNVERENVQRILSVEMPKTIGNATYVATYFTKEYAEGHPDWNCSYNGHLNGDLLQIEGTWDVQGGHEVDFHNCVRWCFQLDDSVYIQASGGDAPDSNLTVMSREELNDMLGGPSGLGLRLVTNEDGKVIEIDWMS